MNSKKLLAVLCACVMVFSLAVPAFAEASPGQIVKNGTQIEFEGSLPDGNTTVSVSVLAGITKLYVNPYGLPYTIADTKIGPEPDSGEDTRDKIKEGTTTNGWFSTTAAIKNESTTALEVSVTMTTTEKGNVDVVSPTDGEDESFAPTKNSLYGYFEIVTATYDAETKTITPGNWDSAETVPIPEDSGVPSDPEYTEYDINGAISRNVDGVPTIIPSYAAFRLRGSAVIGSGSGGASGGDASGWLDTDLADVTVAFSFAPADTTD